MNEMLFDRKNKDYGAYAIRTTYNDAVIKSLLTVSTVLLLFIGSAYAYNNYFAEKPKVKEQLFDYTENVSVIDVTPIEEQKAKPVSKTAASAKTIGIATVIKDEPKKIEPTTALTPISTPEVKGDSGVVAVNPIPGTGGGEPAVIKVVPVDPPTAFADVMPEYPGGPKAMMEFFAKNVVYPERAKILGVEGTVFVTFVVGVDGKIESYKILKGVDEDCNEEALRVVSKMPTWKPGMNGGKPARVMFNLPIKFRLN